MSFEENKAIIRQMIDAFNRQDYAAMDALCSPECAAIFKANMQWAHTTFEGFHFQLNQMIAEGEWVCSRITSSGGHSGVLEGIAPTGKHWTTRSVCCDRVVDGKIVETGGMLDLADILKQLGAVPTLTPVPEPA